MKKRKNKSLPLNNDPTRKVNFTGDTDDDRKFD